MSSVKVQLEHDGGRFEPGSTIQGTVYCHFRSDKSIRGIKVRIYGTEHTEWMDSESYYDSTEKKHKTRLVRYTGNNDFFHTEIFLYGSGSGSHEMRPGGYNYHFSYQLPVNLPGTYNCSNGHIQYYVKAIVDRPMRFDFEDTVNFHLVAPININMLPKHLLEPGSWGDEKTICCWCCKSGPVECTVSMPRKAFAPGEIVVMNVQITNLSNVSVDGIEAKLKQHLKYKVSHPGTKNREDVHTICKTTAPGVGAHGEHEFKMEMQIPQHTSVPNFHSCTLFKVNYILEVECSLPGCHMNLDVTIHVELGNIPLAHTTDRSYQPTFLNQPQPGAVGSGYPSYVGALSPPGSGYPQAPPAYSPPGPEHPPGGLGYPPGGPGYPPGGPGYPPAGSGYPPSGSGYPPPPGPGYPPSGSGYPPTGPNASVPTSAAMGVNNPPGYTASTAAAGKPVYPGGEPSAPSGGGSSIDDNTKAREALGYSGGGAPSAPSAPSYPMPPSYEELSNPHK